MEKRSLEIENFLKSVTGGFQDGSWFHAGFKRTRSKNMYALKFRKNQMFPGLETLIRRNTNSYTHCYFCPQAFSFGNRTKEKLFALHNIVIDIDCHSERYCAGLRNHRLKLLASMLMHDAYSEYGLPLPNYIVFTGRGLQVWWRHEPIYVNKGLDTWVSIVRSFIGVITKMIEDHSGPEVDVMESVGGLEADSQASMNPVGLFRIPGTYNPSANNYATLQECEGPSVVYSYWDLRNFRDEHKVEPVGAKSPKTKKAKKSSIKKANGKKQETGHTTGPAEERSASQDTNTNSVRRWFHHKFDIADWALQTSDKIERLREMRDQDIGEETRNNYCLIHYCLHLTAGMTHKAAMKCLEKFNEGFKKPLMEREIRSTLASAVDKQYKYSIRKIVELLDINKEEAKKIDLSYDFEGVKNAENAANDEEKTSKTDAVQERNKQIKHIYLTTELTQEEIGRQFGLSRISVGHILRKAGVSRADRKAKRIQKLNEKGNSVEQIRKKIGCSDRTVYRALKNTADKNAGGAPEAAQMELVNRETDIANPGISELASVAVAAADTAAAAGAEEPMSAEGAGQTAAQDAATHEMPNDETDAEPGKDTEESTPYENRCTVMGDASEPSTDTMLSREANNGYPGGGGGQDRSVNPTLEQKRLPRRSFP